MHVMQRFVRTTRVTAIVLLSVSTAAQAVKISDITHLQGQRENLLTGLGRVVGLKGTGDGGKFLPSARALASVMQHYGNPISILPELKDAKNVALVSIEAVIGINGGREGEQLDVAVSAIGAAKSLKGGRLLPVPLLGSHKADTTVYAFAGGPITTSDPDTPTVGLIRNGATLETDVVHSYLRDGGYFTLVIDDSHDGWAVAATIAAVINETMSIGHSDLHLATAESPKNVLVKIPPNELPSPASFIGRIQSQSILMPERQARVTVDATTGTIVIDGDVGIAPVAISYKGVSVSTPELLEQQKQAAAGEQRKTSLLNTSRSVPLALLVEVLDQIKMSDQYKINLIRELDRHGCLHGKLVEQN